MSARHTATAIVQHWLVARWCSASSRACLIVMRLSGYLGSVFSGYPIKVQRVRTDG